MGTANRNTQVHGQPLANGQIAKHVNGHAKESTANAEAPGGTAKRSRARAASDDAHENPVAPAPVPPAASATHDANAEAACDSTGEPGGAKLATRAAQHNKEGSSGATRSPVPAATGPLPENTVAFTEAVHTRADFLDIGRRLLNSDDEKIVKGVWEHMLQLRYGKEASLSDKSQRIVIDMPRPKHDDPPELDPSGTTL